MAAAPPPVSKEPEYTIDTTAPQKAEVNIESGRYVVRMKVTVKDKGGAKHEIMLKRTLTTQYKGETISSEALLKKMQGIVEAAKSELEASFNDYARGQLLNKLKTKQIADITRPGEVEVDTPFSITAKKVNDTVQEEVFYGDGGGPKATRTIAAGAAESAVKTMEGLPYYVRLKTEFPKLCEKGSAAQVQALIHFITAKSDIELTEITEGDANAAAIKDYFNEIAPGGTLRPDAIRCNDLGIDSSDAASAWQADIIRKLHELAAEVKKEAEKKAEEKKAEEKKDAGSVTIGGGAASGVEGKGAAKSKYEFEPAAEVKKKEEFDQLLYAQFDRELGTVLHEGSVAQIRNFIDSVPFKNSHCRDVFVTYINDVCARATRGNIKCAERDLEKSAFERWFHSVEKSCAEIERRATPHT